MARIEVSIGIRQFTLFNPDGIETENHRPVVRRDSPELGLFAGQAIAGEDLADRWTKQCLEDELNELVAGFPKDLPFLSGAELDQIDPTLRKKIIRAHRIGQVLEAKK